MEVNQLGLVGVKLKNIQVAYEGLKIDGALNFPRRIKHVALHNLSFGIQKGETVAVMGNNGAGKSTLLRLLAGKIRPSLGEAKISGRIVHLSGVNPGFDVSLSPRQNVQWLAPIYGKDPVPTDNEVEVFSDIGPAYDRPIKTLSGGMRGRVGFGFATSLDPDILIIDEVLGVGDPSFKAKAMARLKEMINRSGIVIMSTHSVGLVKELATRCIILDNGNIIHDGEVDTGVQIYSGSR